jgi:uncharacterized protein (DUF1697 family)
MARYVAFIRGINLGPTNKVPMPRLREVATGLGYTDVATYINSGNLIFTSTKAAAALEKEVSQAIKAEFGVSADVVVRTPKQLEQILAANPYPDGDPSQVTVAFLATAPEAGAKDRVAAVAAPYERFSFSGKQVYVHYAHGIGSSKLAARFSAIVKVSSTVRNVRTIEKILQLATPGADK